MCYGHYSLLVVASEKHYREVRKYIIKYKEKLFVLMIWTHLSLSLNSSIFVLRKKGFFIA